jgi:hypothetical protein
MLAIVVIVWAVAILVAIAGLGFIVAGASGVGDEKSGILVIVGMLVATLGVFTTIVCAELHERIKAEQAPAAVEAPK